MKSNSLPSILGGVYASFRHVNTHSAVVEVLQCDEPVWYKLALIRILTDKDVEVQKVIANAGLFIEEKLEKIEKMYQ